MKMGQAIYQQEQAAAAEQPAEGAEAGSGESDEEVVDAEFSEVDEDSKG
jgi:molecular chaperone DnaK